MEFVVDDLLRERMAQCMDGLFHSLLLCLRVDSFLMKSWPWPLEVGYDIAGLKRVDLFFSFF
jgi:hypothetical protein